jgi:uroporphyrinogen decarboxylase
MTSRERVLNAIAHKDGPLPIDFGGLHSSIHWEGYKKVREYLGWKELEPEIQDWFQMIAFSDEELADRFGADCIPVHTKPKSGWKLEIESKPDGDYFTTELGIVLRRPKDGLWFDLYECPLQKAKDLSDVKKYKFPDPEDPARTEGLKEKISKLRQETDKAIVLFCPVGGLWELSYFIRGLEEQMTDMVLHPEIADYLAAKCFEWENAYFGFVLNEVGEYIDVVQMGGDLGGQNGLLFSRDMYLKYYKSRERKFIDTIKSCTKAHVYMHSCGAVRDVIPDIIENGVEILNPVQVNAKGMDSQELKREFGKDLTFWGGSCDPRILTNGTPEKVEAETRKRIEDFSSGGGYVFASVHNMQKTMPPENIVRMFDVALEYR